jgi:hypothetical protein
MTRRLNDWDYCQRAIYMITVTLADRTQEWLGTLVEGGEVRCGNPVPSRSRGGWRIEPTPYGEAVLEALAEMPRRYPQVQILERQLMPEHFHFIVFVKTQLPKPLGALIRGFKAGAAKRWKSLAENGAARHDGTRAGAVAPHCAARAGAVTPHSCGGCPAWADGFQDTILFREGQLTAMIEYIRDNPRRLAEKRSNPALFKRVASLALPLDGGRLVGRFEALGNRHLLERPLHQVQCSRRFCAYRREAKRGGGMKIARTPDGEPIIESESPEYRERLESALAAAAHGAVVLSPCISDGERQIAREAMKRRLPLVALKNMGFAKMEKPVGRSFDACAEGRLLLLAPAAWPYTTQEKPMTRFDATALNRIAQWLAGSSVPGHSCPGSSVPAHSCAGFPAEINYHGMKPANIDELAEKAVLARKGGAR